MNQTEEELIAALKTGAAQAFKTVVEKYQEMVYNTTLSIVQNETDAEDITQDVFVQVYQSVNEFRGNSKFSTWLYRISIAKALDHEKRRKRKKRFAIVQSFFVGKNEEHLHPVEFNHPGVLLDNKEKASELFKALELIPEKQRIAFMLNKIEGLNNNEIAEIMHTSFYAVESLLARDKINLREKLKNYYLHLSTE